MRYEKDNCLFIQSTFLCLLSRGLGDVYKRQLLFLVTFLASCLGDLDTMPLDNNQLVSDQVYKTKDGYTGVLAKCYSSLILTGQQGGDGGNGDLEGANEGYSGYVRLLFYLQEMSTDNFLMPSSSNGLRKCLNLQWDASNASVVTWTYQRLYMSIAYCNELLRECTEGKLQDRGLWEEMKDEYIGYRKHAIRYSCRTFYTFINVSGRTVWIYNGIVGSSCRFIIYCADDYIGYFCKRNLSNCDIVAISGILCGRDSIADIINGSGNSCHDCLCYHCICVGSSEGK